MRISVAVTPVLLLLFTPTLAVIQPAQADVVYTEVLRGAGQAKNANIPIKSQVYVNGNALRWEAQSAQDTSPPNEYFSSSVNGSSLPRLEILRIDQGMLWTKSASGEVERCSLSARSELTPRARLARMAELADLEVLSSQPVLRRTGFKKDINGYNCDHLFATVTCEARDRKTGETGTLILMNDLWVAENVPGAQEIRSFRRSLGEIYGLQDYFCPDAALFVQALPEQARQMATLMAELKGLPVSATMTAKFKKQSGGGTAETDLMYSLTTDMLDIETIAYSPNIYELPQ